MGQLPAPWDCKYLDKEMMRLSWTNILRVFFGTETFASAYGYFSTIIKKEPAVVGYFTPSSHSLEIVYIFVFVQWTKGHKIPVVIHVKHAGYLPPWGWQLCRVMGGSFAVKYAEIHQNGHVLTLPGYFRPTKLWDLLVINEGRLIAAMEFKSQVGPSFGNNFNNRTEEAIGTALDLWTAFREGAFGQQTRPFVGWLMLLEDAPESRSPVSYASPHFQGFDEFEGASYAARYNILCRKLIQEQLYTTASIIISPRSAVKDGRYSELSEMTGLRNLVSGLAGHTSAEAAKK